MKMATSDKETPAKCFSGILRRMLCTGSLPTHPSDHDSTANAAALDLIKKGAASEEPAEEADTIIAGDGSPVIPGLVARLMGLESMPGDRWNPKGVNSDSMLGRSRSMNSLEYLLQFERMQANTGGYRNRAASFREPPTFLRPQNQDYLVPCFGDVEEKREQKGGKKQRICRGVSRGAGGVRGEIAEEKNKKNKKACECRGRNREVSSKHPPKPVSRRQMSSGKSTYEKKTKKKTVVASSQIVPESNSDTDCVSEPLTSIHHPSGLEGDSRARKKLSPRGVRSEHPFPTHVLEANTNDRNEARGLVKKKKKKKKKDRDGEGETGFIISCTGMEEGHYLALLAEVSRLADKDVKGSNWGRREILEVGDYRQTICTDYGEQILDEMVSQTVDELFRLWH